MNANRQRLAAAVELEHARDGLRVAARAGRSTRVHRQRVQDAEAVQPKLPPQWDGYEQPPLL